MRLFIPGLILLLTVNILIDIYIYKAICRRTTGHLCKAIHLAVCGISALLVILMTALPKTGGDTSFTSLTWLMLAYFSIVFSQIVFVLFDLIARIPQIFHRRRFKPLSCVGAVLGSALFMAMWHGALFGRYHLQTKEVTVDIKNLPESFDGYRIVQISDLHLGTYGNDTAFISRLVDRIDSLHPDLILFTGDIVNRHSSEAVPFTTTLSRLHAPDGVFAILGNHDYGKYYGFSSKEEEKADVAALRKIIRQSGFDLLDADTRIIHRGNDSIAVIGIEYCGKMGSPEDFPDRLGEAYPDITDPVVKILLAHDPAYWEEKILPHPEKNIALTLSGHTHAMQARIFGFSPGSIAHRYNAGLYSDSDSRRHLYVNIGIGTVGAPMRLGTAFPEITLMTLKSQKNKHHY